MSYRLLLTDYPVDLSYTNLLKTTDGYQEATLAQSGAPWRHNLYDDLTVVNVQKLYDDLA